jgi:hypothetical protein
MDDIPTGAQALSVELKAGAIPKTYRLANASS